MVVKQHIKRTLLGVCSIYTITCMCQINLINVFKVIRMVADALFSNTVSFFSHFGKEPPLSG